MIFDSHSHTKFSADSEMKAQEAMDAAEKLGIGIVFTEHIDFSYPGELDFTFSPKDYWKEYEPLRGKTLRLGVEMGLAPGEKEQAEAFIAEVPFDEVIGSIHLIDGHDIYEKDCYEGKTQDEMYRRYFSLMADMVRLHSYIDILGHIDYIARYAPYENTEIQYAVWKDGIDEVLRAVVETDTVLELNTRRFDAPIHFKNLVPIYKRYKELGGKYTSIGSDAHTPDVIGAHFAVAEQFAEACGLVPVTFEARKMQILK